MNKIDVLKNHPQKYVRQYMGSFSGILRWPQLEDLWIWLGQHHEGHWYLYQTDEPVPTKPVPHKELQKSLEQIDRYLHQSHKADYCGVVYVDNLQAPTYIKIYNPKGMGSSCSMSEIPPLPRWIISLDAPEDLKAIINEPDSGHAWWQIWKS